MDLGVSFVDIDVNKLEKDHRKLKKKEQKKQKKERKASQKRQAEKSTINNASESEGSEDAGRKHPSPDLESKDVDAAKASRDDWMTEKSGRNILTGQVEDQAAKADKPETKEPKEARVLQPGLSGGQGLKSPQGPASFGDGGASWRLKALRRAEAQAAEQGTDLESLVSERFGSLSSLTDSLSNRRTAHPKAHLHALHSRAKPDQSTKGAPYLQDLETKKMRKPDSSASLSWRRKGSSKTQESHKSGGSKDRHVNERHRDQAIAGVGKKTAEAPRRHHDSRRDDQGKLHSDEHRRRDGSAERDQGQNSQDRSAASLNRFKNDGSFSVTFQAESESKPKASAGTSQANRSDPSKEAPDTSQHLHSSANAGMPDPADGDNRSAAALLRARLLGKTGAPGTSEKATKSKVELLPSVDMEGRAMPGAFGRDAAGKGLVDGGRKVKKLQRYEEGEKQVYFADDNDKTLDDLVREQRHGGGSHMDSNLADKIARKSRFRERDLDVDDEYEVDGGLEMYEGRERKTTKEKAVKRQKVSQIADLRKTDRALDNCNLCFGSPRMKKQLVIAIGQTAYLSIPERGRLAPLHCCIAPVEHVASSRKTDEHVWTEMRNFKKCILQMYAGQGLNAVFAETAMRLTDRRSHAIIHCIPLDDQAFHRAPLVFKKAMVEAESEWSQHHAKAAIDTRAKGLRGSIPPNFPYFFVEFGLSAGSLHVIDDEDKFEIDFGRSILSGLLGLGADRQHRGAKAEPDAVQRQVQSDFAKQFEPYDWTKQLE